MGGVFGKKIFGDRSSTVINSSNSEDRELPPPNRRSFNTRYNDVKKFKKPFHGKSNILTSRQSSLSNNNNIGNDPGFNPKIKYSPASSSQAGPAQASPVFGGLCAGSY